MPFPQLRGYAPLRVGSTPIHLHHIFGVTIILLFVVGLNFWHPLPPFHGSRPSKVSTVVHSSDTWGRLPRFWSLSGTGDMEGVGLRYPKPHGLKIVGLVFYGRRASVSILDCYLKRNLVENGGFLDEVIFLTRTTDEDDLNWLEGLLETTPSYHKRNVTTLGRDYSSAYDLCEDDVMYIKIDDDVVFIEDSAIPTLVQTRLEHPEYYVVSANVVNQPSLSWVHSHLGTILPYLPELSPPPNDKSKETAWRASELPLWKGPDDFLVPDNFEPPYPGHRWLPLPDGYPIEDTPANKTTYDAFGPTLFHWTIAAQQHYSFLEHLEKNELHRYKFQIWDYQYKRMGIQFIAMMGRDINAGKPIYWDDESYFSEEMPKRLKRRAVIDGRAVISHLSFGPQSGGVATTDALDRYRAFANENICVGW